MPRYFPKRGDFISLDFDPHAGHEQKGRRPALVLSHDAFNRRTGMVIVCPVTNKDRGFPFHLQIPLEMAVTGVVMVDQIKSIDFGARHARFVGTASSDSLEEILAMLDACIR